MGLKSVGFNAVPLVCPVLVNERGIDGGVSCSVHDASQGHPLFSERRQSYMTKVMESEFLDTGGGTRRLPRSLQVEVAKRRTVFANKDP